MKKILFFIMGILIPLSANAATSVTLYVAANCATTSNSAAQGFCDGTYSACSSSGPNVVAGTSYSSYINCGRIYSESLGGYAILCFDANTTDSTASTKLCNWFAGDGGCNDNYLGTTPTGVSFMGSAIGKTVKAYPDQIECCQTCTGYTYTTYLSGSVERQQKNTCSTDGTCAGSTVNAYGSYYCDNGYYSANGTATVSNSSNPNNLQCTSCANLQSGLTQDDVSSPQKSTSPTDCYIPSGHPLTDSLGTYEYTSNCNYSS